MYLICKAILFMRILATGGLRLDPLHDFHSQKGQDKWVYETIALHLGQLDDDYHDGFFVDLAANDPFQNSNTAFVEQVLGWKGVCIEPNKEYGDVLRTQRKCQVFDAPVDCAAGLEIEWVDRGGLGGIVANDTDNSGTNQVGYKRITDTLENILKKANAPNVIDYLSLDVEGAEWRILKNFPFDQYIFRTITIERPPPWLNALLFKNGYRFVKNYMWDTFYVHSSDKIAAAVANHDKFEQMTTKCPDENGIGIAGTDCPFPEEMPSIPHQC
jgi:hypothetical protein